MTLKNPLTALAASAFLAASAAAAPAPAVRASSPLKEDMARGYLMKEQRRMPEALAAFGAALKKDPANHAALSELGYLHAGLKQYAAAAKFLSAAAKQEPGEMRLQMDLGYVYQSLKRPAQAEERFKAVAAVPGELQGQALKELGFMNLAAGRLEAAVANFEALRVLAPADMTSALQLGYTYDRLRKPDQAREAYSAALASTDEKVRDAAQAALKSAPAPSSL